MTDSYKYKPSRPWWIIAGAHLKGSVLVSENIGDDNIKVISRMAENVYILNSESNSLLGKNVHAVDSNTVGEEFYDAIIFDLLDHEEKLMSSLREISSLLKNNGVLCFIQMNPYSIRNNSNSFITNLYGFISKKRMGIIKSDFCKNEIDLIDSHPAVVYDGVVYESQLSRFYTSNKNSFLIKEKIKKYLYDFGLCSYISDSYIYMFGKESAKELTLMNQIVNEIKDHEEITWRGKNLITTKAFYKTGKLLLSLTTRNKKPEYVVVFCLNEKSRLQRENEYAVLKELNDTEILPGVLPRIFGPYSMNNIPYYVIEELEGLTVDEDNENLGFMTESSYQSLLALSDQTLRSDFGVNKDVFHNKILGYKLDIQRRMPIINARYDEFFNLLLKKLNFVSFPMVCMHGDYKLENLILNVETNKVVGIIDWELGDLQGFPLIDLFYLIIYDMHIKDEGDTFHLYSKLLSNNVSNEAKLFIADYNDKYAISDESYIFLRAIYFVHHFSKRDKFDVSEEKESLTYIETIGTLINQLSEIGINE